MKWEDMRQHYAGQWLLIAYQALDAQLNVLEGEVIAHAPNKEEIYAQLFKVKGKNLAIEYAGELSPDLTVML